MKNDVYLVRINKKWHIWQGIVIKAGAIWFRCLCGRDMFVSYMDNKKSRDKKFMFILSIKVKTKDRCQKCSEKLQLREKDGTCE